MIMASKRIGEVAQLNDIVSEYLKQLGISEQARREFSSKAHSKMPLESFQRIAAQILHQIQEPRPDIDLNQPPPSQIQEPRPEIDLNQPPPQHNEVEDEERSHALRKRKSNADLTSGMTEPRNVRPFHHNHINQVPIILLSDGSDSE